MVTSHANHLLMSTLLFYPPLQEKVQKISVTVHDPNFAFREKWAARISDAVRKLAVLSPGFFLMHSEIQRDSLLFEALQLSWCRILGRCSSFFHYRRRVIKPHKVPVFLFRTTVNNINKKIKKNRTLKSHCEICCLLPSRLHLEFNDQITDWLTTLDHRI